MDLQLFTPSADWLGVCADGLLIGLAVIVLALRECRTVNIFSSR